MLLHSTLHTSPPWQDRGGDVQRSGALVATQSSSCSTADLIVPAGRCNHVGGREQQSPFAPIERNMEGRATSHLSLDAQLGSSTYSYSSEVLDTSASRVLVTLLLLLLGVPPAVAEQREGDDDDGKEQWEEDEDEKGRPTWLSVLMLLASVAVCAFCFYRRWKHKAQRSAGQRWVPQRV